MKSLLLASIVLASSAALAVPVVECTYKDLLGLSKFTQAVSANTTAFYFYEEYGNNPSILLIDIVANADVVQFNQDLTT